MMSDQQKIMESGKRVIRLEAAAVASLEERIAEDFARAVQLVLKSRGRIIVTGVGKSGVIGRKISATLSSTGTSSYFLHAAEGAHGDLGMVHRDDVVICISKSGETGELNNLLAAFKKLKVPIIAMTGSKKSTLARQAEVVLDISTGEEACPHDLAPTTSTTATLAMGDALAIALLEQRNFSREDFALLHPGGSLGRRLILTVDDLMEQGEQLPYCFGDETMKKAIIEMAHKRGICPVVDEQFRVKGVITTGDLNRLLETSDQIFNLVAGDVMNRNPKLIVSGTMAATALQRMEEYRVVAVPVVDTEHKLLGVVHLHDILQAGIKA